MQIKSFSFSQYCWLIDNKSVVMKAFLKHLIQYFLGISFIGTISDLLYSQSIQSTILAGHDRTIFFTFTGALFATVASMVFDRLKRIDN